MDPHRDAAMPQMRHIDTLRDAFAGLAFEAPGPTAPSGLPNLPRPLPPQWQPGFYKQVHKLDPELEHSLSTLVPGAAVEELDSLLDLRTNGLICFDDHWSAVAWSRYYHADESRRRNRTCLLHLDDHGDLGSPLIQERGSRWYRILDGIPVCFSEPASMISAIRAGAIDIGSFIVPLIHYLPQLEIRHLAPPQHTDCDRPLFASESIEHYADGTQMSRLGTSHTPRTDGPTTEVEYLRTSNLGEWCGGIPAATEVLLHIDLDFFNDRYGGGARLERGSQRHNPCLTDMLATAREVRVALSTSGILPQIRNITMSLSPGFLPSEYWGPLLEELGPLFEQIPG